MCANVARVPNRYNRYIPVFGRFPNTWVHLRRRAGLMGLVASFYREGMSVD